ncbi:MAG: hypothetical protein H6604_01380 [Flavobacteriales bacterium]|nr:hypothetical protein [Flavobacteriales bacterium]
MSLQERIAVESRKENWVRVAKEVIQNNELDNLMELFLGDNKRITQQASAIIMTIADLDIQLFQPKVDVLIHKLDDNPNPTQKRNIFRILQFIKIPKELDGKVINHCAEILSNVTEPIAVRAFVMQVFYNQTQKYPELKEELLLLIQENINRNPSAGIKSRGNKIINKLRR